jgi:hypothetical protein
MSTAIRLTLFTVFLLAMLIAWQANRAHLYNPTVRTPIPQHSTTQTPTPAELSVRIYSLAAPSP